jgi:hypothetical protein
VLLLGGEGGAQGWEPSEYGIEVTDGLIVAPPETLCQLL